MNTHINTLLWNVCHESDVALTAYFGIVDDILRYELECDVNVGLVWTAFIKEACKELFIYGYCVFRIHNTSPLIMSGRYCEIDINDHNEYEINIFAPEYKDVKGTSGWNIAVLERPQFKYTGKYDYPQTKFYYVIPSIIKYNTLCNNLLNRDVFNSRPSVYTRVDPSYGAGRESDIAWLNNGSVPNINPHLIHTHTDTNSLLTNRSAGLDALRERTAQERAATMRERERRAFEGKDTEVDLDHNEHIITDGRIFEQTQHLQQDLSIVDTVRADLKYHILLMLGVPPHIFGYTLSSERKANSARAQELPMDRFYATQRHIRDLLGYIMSKHNGPSFGRCVTMHVINQIRDFVKPERLAEMLACATHESIDSFDINLIRTAQQQMSSFQAGGAARKQRIMPSEEEKDANMLAKAQVNTH